MDFETWWKQHGQFCRAGGGEYEKTFAFRAWQAAHRVAMAEAFEMAAQVCDSLGGEIDLKNVDEVKLAANSLADVIRKLKK